MRKPEARGGGMSERSCTGPDRKAFWTAAAPRRFFAAIIAVIRKHQINRVPLFAGRAVPGVPPPRPLAIGWGFPQKEFRALNP
jgi:hypothetical protein